jgi:hypothetical protein
MEMLKKALVVVATVLAVTAAASTGASARGGHFHGGGFHGGHGFHGGYYRGLHRGGWGAGLFYAPSVYAGYYGSCYQVRRVASPYGWRLRRVYVCG